MCSKLNIIDLSKIQVDNSKFTPTKNENNTNELGTIGSISPELLIILLKTKDKLRINGYNYWAFTNTGYPIILREKVK